MEIVICFLCRVSLKDRECLRVHLTHEHGVVFNLDFVSRVAQFRTVNARLPMINLNKKNNNRLCYKCLEEPIGQPQTVEDTPKIQEPIKMKLNMSPSLDETVPMNCGPDESTASKSIKVKPKNIRDKTNVFCDVCDVTLDTRILFLKHCSFVHDVKFKGKFGQRLEIPRDTDTSINMSRAEDTEAEDSPARKKRLVDTSLNTSMDPNNPRRAPVACQFCGKIFSNLSNKERHERQSCKNADRGKMEDKEFKCKVENCSRQFSKLGYLKKHMISEHEQPAGNNSD